jgi:hypothetical protein
MRHKVEKILTKNDKNCNNFLHIDRLLSSNKLVLGKCREHIKAFQFQVKTIGIMAEVFIGKS